MKKVLSVILAIMMLFGAMSLTANAEGSVTKNFTVSNTVIHPNSGYVILRFDFGSGSSLEGLYVYDTTTGNFVWTEGTAITGAYLMLPCSYYNLTPGSYVRLPAVSAPESLTCQGWEIRGTGELRGHGGDWKIPDDATGIIELVARYTTAEPEEDTMKNVLNILMKVFGTIIGVLFLDGSAQAGIELMQKVLGGLI